jgi:hypothetical protein
LQKSRKLLFSIQLVHYQGATMAKDCKIGDVLYWRKTYSAEHPEMWFIEGQPKGPLTVVDIIPAPENVTKEGYQWLSVRDKDGSILTQGPLGDEAFGSHLFRKAPKENQPRDLR